MRIGRYADGKGGIYAGIVRGADADRHVFLAEQSTGRDVIYETARTFAASVTADHHSDFRIPTRDEGGLLYVNLRYLLNDGWHWTCEEYPPDRECMWVIAMAYGRHADARKTDACRARAVRTEPCA